MGVRKLAEYKIQMSAESEDEAIRLALEGKSLGEIAKLKGFDNPMQFVRYREKYPIFAKELDAAREFYIHDQVDNLNANALAAENPNLARILSENTKWTAERRLKHIYGQHLDISLTQTIDIAGAIERAKSHAERDVTPQIGANAAQIVNTIEELV